MEALDLTVEEDKEEVIESIEKEWNLASDKEVLNEMKKIYS